MIMFRFRLPTVGLALAALVPVFTHAQRPAITPPPAEQPWPRVGFQQVAEIPRFVVDVEQPDDGTGRFFAAQQQGTIWVVKDGKTLPEPFLDIRPEVRAPNQPRTDERGLLSLVFPPNYKERGHFYVYYTARRTDGEQGRSDGESVISRFKVDPANPDRALPESEEVILRVRQPYPNHNGGKLAFGRDGLLYFGFGDGGAANDPQNAAQNLGTLLGKLIRIDVEGKPDEGRKYRIPPDNPFLKTPGALPEIWALGLRNPWRYSFDRANGDLYIGEVGQNRWEYVHYAPAASKGGENYGWSVYEATHETPGKPPQPLGTPREKLSFPVVEFDRQNPGPPPAGRFISITGGYVYRGSDLPAWAGVYFFSDMAHNQVWALRRDAEGKWQTRQVDANKSPLIGTPTFAQDQQGNVYAISYGAHYQQRDVNDTTGRLYKLVERPAGED